MFKTLQYPTLRGRLLQKKKNKSASQGTGTYNTKALQNTKTSRSVREYKKHHARIHIRLHYIIQYKVMIVDACIKSAWIIVHLQSCMLYFSLRSCTNCSSNRNSRASTIGLLNIDDVITTCMQSKASSV